ncbi:hypothetical protein [Zhongshania sp. BJYM1]|uniref:hypothetical protein n=1 Tax=Zhongshania aquatica TaxID=2965069 RepID=UPI0022B511AD|nr:hypothetical protein [Marortus sp. BJYM1]
MAKFRRRTLHVLIIFLLSALAACGGGGGGGGGDSQVPVVSAIDPSDVNFIPHLSFREKIALVFPEAWNRQDSLSLGEPDVIAAFSEPSEGESDQFLENVLLVKLDSMAEVTGVDVSNIQEISSRQIEVAGFSGEESIFDADVEGVEQLDLRFMLIAFEFDDAVYGLLYSAERRVFERNVEIVRHMASSLNIGQVVFENLNLNSDLSQPAKPAVASDGSNFLTVSCRESEVFPYPSELIGRIVYGNRTMGPEFQIHGKVDTGNTGCRFTRYNAIFDGMNYLVTYMTSLNGERSIVGKRIAPDGNVVDDLPIDISQTVGISAFEPDMVFDGTRTLVVWHESGATHRIKGAFVDQLGGVTNSFIVVDNLSDTYPDPNNHVYSPSVAYGENEFMVIWSPYFFEDTRRSVGMPIFGQLLDLEGNVLLSNAVQIRSDNGDNPRYPQIASDGNNYVVGWIEGLLETNTIMSGSFTVYARQINSSGELVDAAASDIGIIISPPIFVGGNSSEEVPKDFLDLSYEDGNYLFLWSSSNFDPETGVYGVKVSRELESISAAIPISGLNRDTLRDDLARPSQANVAYSDTANFVLWPSRSGVVEGWFMDKEKFD